jgi:hypothetical protein
MRRSVVVSKLRLLRLLRRREQHVARRVRLRVMCVALIVWTTC